MSCSRENCTQPRIPRGKYCEDHRSKKINKRKLCTFIGGCTKLAQGKSDKCKTHGGGNRCAHPECTTAAVDKSDKCIMHGGGIRCTHLGCMSSARSNSDKCGKHGGGKRCTQIGCTKGAIGKSDKCRRHGGGDRCTHSGCTKSADRKSNKCVAHGGGIRCAHNGCTKSAVGKTNKCVEHGGGKRCTHPGCTKVAAIKSDKCVTHGGGDRCTHSGCTKGAARKSNKCVAHGGGNRCTYPECTKSAQGKTDRCKAHGGGKRCTYPKCTKSAQGTTNKCIEHGGGNRCPNCINWPDSRSSKPIYDNYCATCFKRLFPADPRSTTIHIHTKEIRVRNSISEAAQTDSNFEGFLHDRPLYTGHCDCTHRRRVDHRKLIGNTILAVETDEFAHRSYDKIDEEIRYDDLYMIHSGKWIYIRYNPDAKDIDMDDTLPILLETIEEQIRRIHAEENAELVEIIRLFY